MILNVIKLADSSVRHDLTGYVVSYLIRGQAQAARDLEIPLSKNQVTTHTKQAGGTQQPVAGAHE